MKRKKHISRKVIFLIILIYIVCIFINQQKILNRYTSLQKQYKAQLDEKMAYRENLQNTKSNINSKEYIESIARDRLDMYLPNERVYLDKGN